MRSLHTTRRIPSVTVFLESIDNGFLFIGLYSLGATVGKMDFHICEESLAIAGYLVVGPAVCYGIEINGVRTEVKPIGSDMKASARRIQEKASHVGDDILHFGERGGSL